MSGGTLRIGVLGAARITPPALIRPARKTDGVDVVAVAARDRSRAQSFANKHGLAHVFDDYAALVQSDEIDAVYNPLPNGLHGHWTAAAVNAGKHVLCEKPFTANAAEARAVAAVCNASDRVVMEAFHWRYHPLALRTIELAHDGTIGELREVHARFIAPLPMRNDIRWDLSLAGGSMMDMGCYTVSMVRHVSGAEPTVVSASAKERSPGVDRHLEATLDLGGGMTGSITTGMWSGRVLSIRLRVIGSKGRLDVFNPLAPQFLGRLTVRTGGSKRSEWASRTPTYTMQLRAFVAAVRDGADFATTPDDAVANMEVIDEVYRATGMAPREPTPVSG